MFNEKKTNRLFIGTSIVAPWPDEFPSNEVIKEENRHITICFFGQQNKELIEQLVSFPKPDAFLSPIGIFSRYVGLPKKHPRLIAMEGKMINGIKMDDYQKEVVRWAEQNKIDFKKDKRPFYPHVTMCRKNPDVSKWEKTKINIPFYLDGVHLYQSLQNSEYEKLKTYPFIPVFEQIRHTADIAFFIRGNTLQILYVNAQLALAFIYPDFLDFLDLETKISTKEQIVMALNEIVSRVDIEIGCSFKAVSFHGSFSKKEQGYTEWEMIVDV